MISNLNPTGRWLISQWQGILSMTPKRHFKDLNLMQLLSLQVKTQEEQDYREMMKLTSHIIFSQTQLEKSQILYMPNMRLLEIKPKEDLL